MSQINWKGRKAAHGRTGSLIKIIYTVCLLFSIVISGASYSGRVVTLK